MTAGPLLIRPLGPADASEAARMHAGLIPGSTFRRFGTGFLTVLYETLPDVPGVVCRICICGDDIAGFICASADPGRLMRGILLRRPLRLAAAIAAGLLRSPGLARAVVQTPFYFRRDGASPDTPELLFIAVKEQYRRKGVAGRLVREALARLPRPVTVTIDAGNATVRRLLLSEGFVPLGRFIFYGRARERYVLAAPERTAS